MMLLGIISISVIPNWDNAQANLNHQAALLSRNLSHTQVLAMNRGSALTVNFSSKVYSVSDAGGIITGVAFSSWSDFTIDMLGRPNSGVVLSVSPFTQTLLGGARSKLVTISPISGLVTVTEG
jgi:hypothetical protein